jgi:uncharacterized protein (DUF849 family)
LPFSFSTFREISGLAIERGGHLQVGLEPSGDPRRSNLELVNEAVELCERLGCRPATSAEAADILGLPDRGVPD